MFHPHVHVVPRYKDTENDQVIAENLRKLEVQDDNMLTMGPSASEMIDKEEAGLGPHASRANLDLSLSASGYRDRQRDEERAEVDQVRHGT